MTTTYDDAAVLYDAALTYDDVATALYDAAGIFYDDSRYTYDGTLLFPPGAEVEVTLDVAASGTSDRSGSPTIPSLSVLFSVPGPTGSAFHFPSGDAAISAALAVTTTGGRTSGSGEAFIQAALAVSATGAHDVVGDVVSAVVLEVIAQGLADHTGAAAVTVGFSTTAAGEKPTEQGYVTLSMAVAGLVIEDTLR